MSRAVCLCVAVLVAVLAVHVADAKLVSVSGQVTIVNSNLPPNLWSEPANAYSYEPSLEVPSPSINGVLGLGVFDEQLGVVLNAAQAASFQLSNGAHLTPGTPYDALYVWGHQTWAIGSSLTYTASGTVTTDNLVIGCTSSDGNDDTGAQEIASTPLFGLSSIYYQNVTQGARGFELGDFGTAFGTTVQLTNTWTEPGDYTRCFSISCNQPTCGCQVSASITDPNFCVDTTAVTLTKSQLTTSFSTTCSGVTSDSFYYSFIGAGASSDGSSITIQPGTSSISVRLTAGCGCFEVEFIPIPSCSACAGCQVAHRQGCNSAYASSTSTCVSMDFNSAPATSCSADN